MEIIEYDPKYKDKFIEFNKDWIIEYFGFVEQEDVETFNNIEKYLTQGSMVYFAIEGGVLLSGCMAKKVKEGVFEICKLCSNKYAEHKGAGSAVFGACMDWAAKAGAEKIYIISNKKLNAALHIYKKFGFKEIPLNDSRYKRGDIAFEYEIKRPVNA